MKSPIPKRFLSRSILALGERRQASILRRTEVLADAFHAETKMLAQEVDAICHTKIKNRADLDTARANLSQLINRRQKLKQRLTRVVGNAHKHFEEFSPLDKHRHSSENRVEATFHNVAHQLESLNGQIERAHNDLYLAQHKVTEKERNALTWGE